MDGITPDDHLEAAFEDRVSGDEQDLDPPVGHVRASTHRLYSRAVEAPTLEAVVAGTNRILAELRVGHATILSVSYTRQEMAPDEGAAYLGAILFRGDISSLATAGTLGSCRILPFRTRLESSTVEDVRVASLAHAVPTAAPARLTREERADELRQQTATAIGRLAEQLAEGYSDGFRAYLSFSARFWEYSAHNALLIYLQRPTATRCAGMSLWNRLGYTVRKGERGLWIWAPVLRRTEDRDAPDGEAPEHLVGFRPAAVFDVGQLDGIEERPLPTPVPALPDDAHELLMALLARVRAHGITITLRELPEGTAGWANPGGITLDPRGDSRNRLFVLLHELAHMLAHVAPLVTLVRSASVDRAEVATRRQEAEFEAESAAYAVAAILGFDHPGARDYLLHYRATPEVLSRRLGAIKRLVQQMLAVLGISGRPARPLGTDVGAPDRRIA